MGKLRADARELLEAKALHNPEKLVAHSRHKYEIGGFTFYFDTGVGDWIIADGTVVYADGWIAGGSWVGVIESYLDRIAAERHSWEQTREERQAVRLVELDEKYRGVTL